MGEITRVGVESQGDQQRKANRHRNEPAAEPRHGAANQWFAIGHAKDGFDSNQVRALQ